MGSPAKPDFALCLGRASPARLQCGYKAKSSGISRLVHIVFTVKVLGRVYHLCSHKKYVSIFSITNGSWLWHAVSTHHTCSLWLHIMWSHNANRPCNVDRLKQKHQLQATTCTPPPPPHPPSLLNQYNTVDRRLSFSKTKWRHIHHNVHQ